LSYSWYKRALPKIKDITPHIEEIAKTIKKIEGINELLLWGSFIKYADKPNHIIKDIDLIAKTSFFSEDLITITDNEDSLFQKSTEILEEEGFDPKCVNFTKEFLSFKDYNIDHWAISDDKKLLHWGIISDSRDGWDELKKEAENYADSMTGNKNLSKLKQIEKDQWSKSYDFYVNKALVKSKAPTGWYLSAENIEEILKETKTI